MNKVIGLGSSGLICLSRLFQSALCHPKEIQPPPTSVIFITVFVFKQWLVRFCQTGRIDDKNVFNGLFVVVA